MLRMFNADKLGDIIEDLEESMSVEDRVAQPIMIETTMFKYGHYQIELPFKHNPPHLQDSLRTAKNI